MKPDWNNIFKTDIHYAPVNDLFLDKLLSHIMILRNNKKIERAADLGCGRGELVIKLAKRGIKVMGLDISSVAIDQARAAAQEEKVADFASFKEFNLDNLTLFDPSEYFDLIFNKLVLVFIEDKKTFLAKVKRLLRKDGVFVLMTPVLKEGIEYSDGKEKNISVPEKEVEELLNKIFGNFELYESKVFGKQGLHNTYIMRN